MNISLGLGNANLIVFHETFLNQSHLSREFIDNLRLTQLSRGCKVNRFL